MIQLTKKEERKFHSVKIDKNIIDEINNFIKKKKKEYFIQTDLFIESILIEYIKSNENYSENIELEKNRELKNFSIRMNKSSKLIFDNFIKDKKNKNIRINKSSFTEKILKEFLEKNKKD